MAQVQIGINLKFLTTVIISFWSESSSSIGQFKAASHSWCNKKGKRNLTALEHFLYMSVHLLVWLLESSILQKKCRVRIQTQAWQLVVGPIVDVFIPRVHEMIVTFNLKFFNLRWLKNERNCVINLSFFLLSSYMVSEKVL